MPEFHVLRVFVNEDREWGNRLGVFLEGAAVPEPERAEVAATLGFSETVFVDDPAKGEIAIRTPRLELPFAGHPTVGTAWLLSQLGSTTTTLRPPAGAVRTRTDRELTWVEADPEWAPPFEYRELPTPVAVRTLERPRSDTQNTYAWSWIDEAAGTIYARSFAPAAGIAEDEATGSAVLALCARLARPIVVHQGHGSLLLAQPTGRGGIEVGGRVVLEGIRSVALSGGTA